MEKNLEPPDDELCPHHGMDCECIPCGLCHDWYSPDDWDDHDCSIEPSEPDDFDEKAHNWREFNSRWG